MLTDKEKSLLKIQATIHNISMLNSQILMYLALPEHQLIKITDNIEANNKMIQTCFDEINTLLQDSDNSDFLSSFNLPFN